MSSPAPTLAGDSDDGGSGATRKLSESSLDDAPRVPVLPVTATKMGLNTPASATMTSLSGSPVDPEKQVESASPYSGSGTPQDPFVVKWLDGEKQSPYNWSTAKKWTCIMISGMTCLNVAFGSSVYAGSARQLMSLFNLSSETFTLGLTFYVIGFALGPMLWAPLSELYGRRPIFMASFAPFFLFNIGCAVSQNIESLLVCRLFAGFFGSSPLTVSGGVIADCFLASERALAMGVFAIAPWLGPILGPICGAFMGQYVDWRWIFWLMVIFSGVMLVIGSLVPETYSPILLRRRANRLTEETGLRHVSMYDLNADENETVFSKLKTNCSRPFVLLAFEPIVLLFAIYAAVVYAELYIQFPAFGIIFGEGGRGWSTGIAGLPFIGMGVGMLLAIGLNTFVINKKYARDLANNGGRPLPPEARLPACCLGGILLPVGLFWFAWTVRPSVHWIVPVLALVPFGMGQVLLFLPMMNMLVDVYLIYAASALAANAVVRSILGAVLPLASAPLFHALGNDWALTLLAFMALLLAPIPFLFLKYGARIRARSRFAPGHRDPTPQDNPAVTKEVEEADLAQLEAERQSVAEQSRQDLVHAPDLNIGLLESAPMSIKQVPFLALIEECPTNEDQQLLAATARVAPFLVATPALAATLKVLPPTAEYYALQTEQLSFDDICSILDAGAVKIVTKDVQLVGKVPADRLVLHIDPSTATALADPQILQGISSVLVETPTLAENLLKSFRAALKVAQGRPRDLFVLSSTRDSNTILHQPASLKLMSQTVNGVSVLPLSFLSTALSTLPAPQPQNGKLPVTNLFTSMLRTDREDHLYPTLPVSLSSVPTPLGLVYSSAASIANTIVSGNAVYYSRSRQGLWRKGETSGAMQIVERIRMDCDSDAVEFGVVETGPAGEKEGFCHVPDQQSCFGGSEGLAALESTLRQRYREAPAGSYTARLFSEPALLKAKILEEASELCEAQSKEDIAAEAADLLYFALTKCVGAGIGLKEIGKVLDKRALKVTRRKGDAKKEWADKLGLSEGQSKGVTGGVNGVSTSSIADRTKEPIKEEAKEAREDLKCLVYDYNTVDEKTRRTLLKRPTASSTDMIARVQPIMDTVRGGGDAGLRSLVVKFDRCEPASDTSFPLVMQAPFSQDLMQLDPKVKSAIDQAYSNIKAFHQAQMDKEQGTLRVETMPGIVCSRFARPIERVGLYVPGGTAILPSTALMLAVPAQVANCSTLTLATPPRPDGTVSPEIVYIASLTGVGSIVRAGGAHAVAAMAYGTETVPKVDKIFGPGNQFVTAAKMAVSMDSEACCAIDMPAGPSEVLVIADKHADSAFVASDLLSQAEHGADSQVILLTVDASDEQIMEIESEIKKQALALPRVDIIRKSIAHSLIIKCKDLDQAIQVSNDYAPEHLILQLQNAAEVVSKINNAGSIFVGAYSPESCGDYASGTNHTLPTAGWAKQYSGVSTLSFLKHITAQELSADGLGKLGPVVETLAKAEGLNAHQMAVTIRLNKLGFESAA
ncbi:trifunctional histidinol dehydrogenase [Microbotryomycetes sp. JL201]|nr:trifunctional histidinol dehydrogenase [Microbotryomycetes sp. JL201]